MYGEYRPSLLIILIGMTARGIAVISRMRSAKATPSHTRSSRSRVSPIFNTPPLYLYDPSFRSVAHHIQNIYRINRSIDLVQNLLQINILYNINSFSLKICL